MSDRRNDVPDSVAERLRVQIDLNARAAERAPLPVPGKNRRPEGNHITEDDLLRGYGLKREAE
jgi:hypothetical protein